MNQTGTGGLTVVQSECKTKLSYRVVECILEYKKTLSLEYPQLSNMQIYFWQFSSTVFTRARTPNVNKLT